MKPKNIYLKQWIEIKLMSFQSNIWRQVHVKNFLSDKGSTTATNTICLICMCIIKDIYVYNAEDKLLLAFAHTHIPIIFPSLFLFYSAFIIVFEIFLFLGIIYVLNLYNIGISSLFVNGLFINSCGLSHQTHQTNITANRPSDRSFDQSNKQTNKIPKRQANG